MVLNHRHCCDNEHEDCIKNDPIHFQSGSCYDNGAFSFNENGNKIKLSAPPTPTPTITPSITVTPTPPPTPPVSPIQPPPQKYFYLAYLNYCVCYDCGCDHYIDTPLTVYSFNDQLDVGSYYKDPSSNYIWQIIGGSSTPYTVYNLTGQDSYINCIDVCQSVPPTCYCYEITPTVGGCYVDWTNCDGSAGSSTVAVKDGYSIYICARENEVTITPMSPGDEAQILGGTSPCTVNEDCSPIL